MRKLFSVSVLGASLMAIGILCNPWVLAVYFTQDGRLGIHTRTALLIFDFIVILWGMVILYQRRSWKAKQIGYLLVTTVIALVIVESGFQLIAFVKDMAVGDVRRSLSAYKNEKWGDEYWKEYRATKSHYVPFVLWDVDEFHGKWINIDRNGRRKTWTPPKANTPSPEKIYVMGGSAIWGIGARDDYTIPSDLSKLLNADNKQYVISNYGTPGFTFIQEAIKLIILLKDGHRPDYVIFYDGANDVYAAYQSGMVLDLLDFSVVQEKLETSPVILGIKYLIANSRIVQVVEKTLVFLNLQYKYQEGGSQFTDRQIETLGEDIAERYKKTAKLVQRLSEVYNFKYLLFWQPVIFTESIVVEEEVKVDPHCQDKNLGKLFKIVKGNLTNSSISQWIDLADVLHQAPKPMYIDFCHMTEKGYGAVAAEMAASLRQEFKAVKTVPRQPGKY